MGQKCDHRRVPGVDREKLRVKILLLGSNGQVGWELQRSLAPLGELKACDRKTVDLETLKSLQTTVREYSPTVIVNAAAYTAVDKAESEPDKARQINAKAVGLLADEAKRLGAWLVHYSTDYVFDGEKAEPYVENDKVNPLCVYGKTKLEGEEAIIESGVKHLIFRTSWVFSARGANFAKTMLRLASEREELKVVADQTGAPTSAELLTDVTALALYRIATDAQFAEKAAGIYHLTASGETNWREYAQLVIRVAEESGIRLKAKPETVLPVSTSEYPTPAKRPLNSRLNTKKLRNTFGINLPPWQDGVIRMLDETLGVDGA